MEKSIETQYEQASRSYDANQQLLEQARTRRSGAKGPVRQFLAERSVRHLEVEAYDSDEHLGMIEAMKLVQDGEDPESVLNEFRH